MESYRHGSHSVFSIHLHLVWITKYRKRALTGEVAVRVRDIIRELCRRDEVEILHCKGARSCFLSKHFQATSFATSASRSLRAAVMICCPLGVTR